MNVPQLADKEERADPEKPIPDVPDTAAPNRGPSVLLGEGIS